MVMVTHDAQGGDDRRPGPLPRRRAHRPRSRPRRRGTDPRDGQGSHADVIRVALRGLAGRKLRAFLTALAIVLGVAMVSGTFVLTDMIDRAFNDIFTQSYANTDAYVSGKSPRLHLRGRPGNGAVGPGEPPADRCASCRTSRPPPGPSPTSRRRRSSTARESRSRRAARRRSGSGSTTREPQFNPLKLTAGRWPTLRTRS